MSVRAIESVEKLSMAYLSVGIDPQQLDYSKDNGPVHRKHVVFALLNVTSMTDLYIQSSGPSDAFMMDIGDDFESHYISTSISQHLLRIRIEFEVYLGVFTVHPNPIWFTPSFPGKARQSQRVLIHNEYDIDLEVEMTTGTESVWFPHNSMSQQIVMLFLENMMTPQNGQNMKNGKTAKNTKNEKQSILVPARSEQVIAKMYFEPNGASLKYGDFVRINSSERSLLDNMRLFDGAGGLMTKYGAFKALKFGAKCLVNDIDFNSNCIDLHAMHRPDLTGNTGKGVDLRELFIEVLGSTFCDLKLFSKYVFLECSGKQVLGTCISNGFKLKLH